MIETSIPGVLAGAGRNGMPETRRYVYRGTGVDVLTPTAGPGFCACDCGMRTELARRSDARFGMVKGKPLKYARGHSKRWRKT